MCMLKNVRENGQYWPHLKPDCSFMMEYDIHTILDALTLLATGVIVYCMTSTEVALTYQKEQDKVQFYYVVRFKSPAGLLV